MRVVLATYDSRGGVEPLVGLALALRSETRARAAAVSGTIRADGAAVAARLLLNEVSGREPPPSAR